jgi:diketogulonate reductase-like aldo/keto reductase
MRYENIHNLQIPKIGFGTWTIGGRSNAEPSWDEKSLLALRSALELGYTHFDTAENYAAGHSEELVGRVIREMGAPREKLFITTKVEPDHLQYEAVLRCCENSLRRLGMEYVDLYLIHWPRAGMKLPETFRALNQLVREGKVRSLGVSNST